jgi:iron complex outermembrane receptor protein
MVSPVYATPRHHLFLSCDYRLSKWLFTASAEYVNHLDTDPSTKVSYQTYTLVNSKISYQAWKFAVFFISAENILNQKYENNRYYPMPGITVFGGIRMKI